MNESIQEEKKIEEFHEERPIFFSNNGIALCFGFDCNFKCKFCFEKDYKREVFDFDKERIIKYLKKTANKVKNSFRLTYFGGEPLLHWNHVKTCIEELKGISNIIQFITTNASLLNEEMVRVFNNNHISVDISYDKMHTEFYDILKDAELIRLINKIENKSFIVVPAMDDENIRDITNKILKKFGSKTPVQNSHFQYINSFKNDISIERIEKYVDDFIRDNRKKIIKDNEQKGFKLLSNGNFINPFDNNRVVAYIDDDGNKIIIKEAIEQGKKISKCDFEKCEYFKYCASKKYQIDNNEICKLITKKIYESGNYEMEL